MVLEKLISHLKCSPELELIVAVHPSIKDKLELSKPHELYSPKRFRGFIGHLYWYEYFLPRFLNHNDIDVFFSITNYIPLRSINCTTVLLEQHAGHFSSDFEKLHIQQYTSIAERIMWMVKTAWVRDSVKRADFLTVQTHALASDINSVTHRSLDDIYVIPHGPGLADSSSTTERIASSEPLEHRKLRLGFVSKRGVQKNFHILISACI